MTSLAWIVAQPMGDPASWMPLLYVAFLIASFLLAGWGWHVETELRSLRTRLHEAESQIAGLTMLEQHREGK